MNLMVLTEFVVEMLLALPVFLVWLTVISLLVRPFGVRLPLTPFSWAKHRFAFQALSFPQYVMIGGIFYFGCGMLVVTTLSRYLEWKYWNGSSLTSEHLLRDGLQYLLSWVLFGVISYLSLGNRAK